MVVTRKAVVYKVTAEAIPAERPLYEEAVQEFEAQMFPYMKLLYSEALCLTGSPKKAADLVVETYVRAFRAFWQSLRRILLRCLQIRGVRPCRRFAWLLHFMHMAFCEEVFAHARQSQTRSGGKS